MSRLFFTLFIASLINMFLLPEAFAVDVEEVESSEDAAITEDDAVEPVIAKNLKRMGKFTEDVVLLTL